MSICRQSSTFILTTYLQQGHKARVELHISFEKTTFLLLLSSNIGKVAELWTLEYGNSPV